MLSKRTPNKMMGTAGVLSENELSIKIVIKMFEQ